ncbi:MAG TPA: DUF389 domain-containing protein [Jatrophihabitantaceae bacterium]|nr:DUF389 domain-containing protein [Jatrophihabitantaceae bacterium]
MAMVHLRVVCPADIAEQAVRLLSEREGVVAVGAGRLAENEAGSVVVHADLARECADATLRELKRLGVTTDGMITLDPIDTALGDLVERAEHDAPGEGADAVVWDELAVRTGEDSQLTWTFGTFMVLATLLASIGIMTDSPITIVGAMVVGPEFGPLAGLAVGLVRRRPAIARRASIALLIGFPLAILGAAAFTLVARGAGLISADVLDGHRQTEFIYHPGWFSFITAIVAGTAGMLSLTSTKSAALVGVFISVTTIPAAGNVAVAAVLKDWYESGQSLLQLGINLIGIVVAGSVTLAVRSSNATVTRFLR